VGQKISLAKQNISQETRDKLSKANTGKIRTEEHRRNMSIAQKKRFSNPEEVEKTRQATLEWYKNHSAETEAI